MKRYGPALSWDEIADVFDKYSGNGGRQARTCPMYVIVAWAEAHPEIFHVAEDETFHLIREEEGMSDSCSHLDQMNRLLDMLDRRDKQLKRVIYSAREWRRATDIRGEIIDVLTAEIRRMVRALEDMTPGGSEFYCDFDRCLAFVQQKIESLQEIAKRKSAILPAPPEDV